MAERATEQLKTFYDAVLTLPKLLGDIGMSIAEAQRGLDQNYVEALAEVIKVAAALIRAGDPSAAATFEMLLKTLAPSRYEFTETVVEVRADLQMTTASELKVGGVWVVRAASREGTPTSGADGGPHDDRRG